MTDTTAPQLTTVAMVKRYLRMTPEPIAGTSTTESADDALIQILVDAVADAIARFCYRNFLSHEYTEVYDGSGSNVLVLPNYPISSVESLALVNARTVADGLQPSVDLTERVDFAVTPYAIKLYSMIFPRGVANVAITYTAGYTTAPKDLQHAAAKWSARRYREMERLGQKSKTIGGETVLFDISENDPDGEGILERYRARAQVPGSALLTPR